MRLLNSQILLYYLEHHFSGLFPAVCSTEARISALHYIILIRQVSSVQLILLFYFLQELLKMLTKEYRFSLIVPLLLICSFDLPDSTIQIIRGVPVFHATNVMPKLNQIKVYNKERGEGNAVKELSLTLSHQMTWKKSRPPEEVPAKFQHAWHPQKTCFTL